MGRGAGDLLDQLDILLDRVEQTLRGKTFENLLRDQDALDAITYRLSMIGETCKKLPDGLKARYPALPWKQMTGFRNIASHDYLSVVPAFVWAAAQELAPIRAMCDAELARLDGRNEPQPE
jgi:uncharacterized protein with HEPN domain